MAVSTVREELLKSPFTEDDAIIREFAFHSDSTLMQKMSIWEFKVRPTNKWLSSKCEDKILCLPCLLCECATYDTRHRMTYENSIESLYSRRLAVSKDGIVFMKLLQKPVTWDPLHPCAYYCCKTVRDPSRELGAYSKFIPFDQVQDIVTKAPAGGTRQVLMACNCVPCERGEMIPNVDATCDVDTAGGNRGNRGKNGVEIRLPGLVNAPNFRETVLALKHGRELPPLENGVSEPNNLPAPALPLSRDVFKQRSRQKYMPAPDAMERC